MSPSTRLGHRGHYEDDDEESSTNYEDLFPSITSPTSKIKSLKSLKAIHKEISSILNPKLEQCRFVCPATQIISESRHRVVILSLIYHRQNRGEYAVFIFNENLKLRECIPIKSFNFFVQLQQPPYNSPHSQHHHHHHVKRNPYDEEMIIKFQKSNMWLKSDENDDEYEDDYTALSDDHEFKKQEWKRHKFLASSTRLVLYQVLNEDELVQDFVFSFQNDQQLMTCLMTLSNICSEMDVENQHLTFDQIFELPYDLEYAIYKDEMYDETKSNIYRPPNGYQFFTSLSNIKDQMKRAHTFMNLSQQSILLRQQIQRKALEQSFASLSSQISNSNKKLSSKMSSSILSVGTSPTSSLLSSSLHNKEEKRKSLNNNNNSSLYSSLLQSALMNNSNSSMNGLQSKSGAAKSTPQPFEWVLFFIERYELDVNEIEFLNPLYQDMEDEEELTEIKIIEKKKATLVEEDLVTIPSVTTTSSFNNGNGAKKNSTLGTGPEEDEYAWLLKRSENDIEEYVNSIQAHYVQNVTKSVTQVSSTPSNKNGGISMIAKTGVTHNTSSVSTSSKVAQITKIVTSHQQASSLSPLQSTSSSNSTATVTPTTTTTAPKLSSEPIQVSGYQSSLISKLQSISSPTTTTTSNSPPTSTSNNSTQPVSNVKVIASTKHANVAAQQQKEEDDSDISISISSSSEGEDDDDDLMLSSDDDE
nr:unnamed protein product [Naegleria fowleri]